MDIDMDIDYDAGAIIEASAQQPVQTLDKDEIDAPVPAAYLEDLSARPVEQWPEYLNVQGVTNFDDNDPLYYVMEHCMTDPRIKQHRWVNDQSVNLQFYNAEDAAKALRLLTDPEAGDADSLSPETARIARPYTKKPGPRLLIRQANAGDQKQRGAANRSNYYKHNPEARGNRGREREDREPRRRPAPRRDFLDYDGGDDVMRDDSDFDNRRHRRPADRGRGGRFRDNDRERAGRLRGDVDSYRPGSESPRESRFGRLRGRSASPASEDGDGRFGFNEDGTSTRRRYRSRSRSRDNRRRHEPSGERWTHDRAGFGDQAEHMDSGDRWVKDTSALRYSDAFSNTSNHRRSDATDETANSRSLLSRMTKDGQPLAGPKKRSLASRITRDDDGEDNFGRLKNDFNPVRDTDFSEPPRRDGLASRITRDDDEIHIRGRGEQSEGINIRGTASQGGFSIRGMAGGA